jgi:hypothetical protein
MNKQLRFKQIVMASNSARLGAMSIAALDEDGQVWLAMGELPKTQWFPLPMVVAENQRGDSTSESSTEEMTSAEDRA